MILLSQVHAFGLALPHVPLMVMWGKLTPKSEMLADMLTERSSSSSWFIDRPNFCTLEQNTLLYIFEYTDYYVCSCLRRC